jgi:drug/metabolite transporter (DMT)-like permease
VGDFSLSLSFLWRLGTNPYFVVAMLTALAGVVVTYVGRSSIGLGKAALFYGVGTIALVVTSHVAFGEKFDAIQIIGAALVLSGTILLVQ